MVAPGPTMGTRDARLAVLQAPPGSVAADEVGGAIDAEVEEGGGGEAGLVAVVAEEDDVLTRFEVDDPGVTRRRKPPFQDHPVDYQCPRHVTFVRPIVRRPDVDEQCAVGDRRLDLLRADPVQAGAGILQVLVDGGHLAQVTESRARHMPTAT